MFIFDFVAETVLDQIIDWLYGRIVGFLNDFFAMMNNMGVELFASGCKPDMLFLDIQMPGKNGMETARILRQKDDEVDVAA
mgnify:CR=1 FL=1